MKGLFLFLIHCKFKFLKNFMMMNFSCALQVFLVKVGAQNQQIKSQSISRYIKTLSMSYFLIHID